MPIQISFEFEKNGKNNLLKINSLAWNIIPTATKNHMKIQNFLIHSIEFQ